MASQMDAAVQQVNIKQLDQHVAGSLHTFCYARLVSYFQHSKLPESIPLCQG